MPELAEVEVARTRVASWWRGHNATTVHVEDAQVLTCAEGLDPLDVLMRQVLDVRRRGKYLIVDFEDDAHAIFHFRMTGKITLSDAPTRRFTRLSLHLPHLGWLVFDDARRLGGVLLMEGEPLDTHPPLVEMGPEPHDILDAGTLRDRFGTSRKKLKDLLLDQQIIAGVGNIAISELFWRVGIHPEVRGKDVSEALLDALVREMPLYFDWLVEDQMSDEIIYLNEGKGENPFDVYAREDEACSRCGAAISRLTFGGRSTYYCEVCQPEL